MRAALCEANGHGQKRRHFYNQILGFLKSVPGDSRRDREGVERATLPPEFPHLEELNVRHGHGRIVLGQSANDKHGRNDQ